MLPSGENIDDLILEFESDKVENNLTYSIKENPLAVKSKTNAILGIGTLGSLKLNVSTDTSDTVGSVLSGTIDDLDALKQSIYLMLNIEADQFIIYPYTYGLRTLDLIGKPIYYVMAIIPERIKETLLFDDRITDVSDFEFEMNKNKLGVKFNVTTIYGNIEEETVVLY